MLHYPVSGAEVDPAARLPLQEHRLCCSLDSLCGHLGLNKIPPSLKFCDTSFSCLANFVLILDMLSIMERPVKEGIKP